MTAVSVLAAAVSRRPRWEYDPATDQAYLWTGASPTEATKPTGPWALVTPGDALCHWVAFQGQARAGGQALGSDSCPDPDAALDAAERAVDAVVVR
jgi:hypothetical protein